MILSENFSFVKGQHSEILIFFGFCRNY